MDSDRQSLTARSARDHDDSGFDFDKDTLDMIKVPDWGRNSVNRKSMSRRTKAPMLHDEEEQKLVDDEGEEVNEEWAKFLEDAKKNPQDDDEDPKSVPKMESTPKEDKKARVEYYRKLVTPDITHLTEKQQNAEAPSLYAQSVNDNRLISEKDIDSNGFNKNVTPILNIEIILLVLSRKSLHLSLASDMEIARWKKFLKKFLKKNGANHEGLFGMAQINFSIGMHEIAVEFAAKADEIANHSIATYSAWKSIYLYFIYINFKSYYYKSTKVADAFLACENAALNAVNKHPENYSLMYLICILSCEKISLHKDHKGLHNSALKAPTNYASKIMKKNKYLGYMSWVEIYIRDKKKVSLANEVLQDLMVEYPKHPHAFLRKWRKEFDNDKFIDWIQPLEDLFLKEDEMYSIPELNIIIGLLYAKSLVKTNQYTLACDLLKNEFYKKPIHTAYLYYYGVYAVQSPIPNFHWTAIGLLKECLNSWVSQRSPKINYFLGQAYEKVGQPLKAIKYFDKAKSAIKKNKSAMESFCLYDIKPKDMEKYQKVQHYEFVIKKKTKEIEYYLKKNKKRPKISEKEVKELMACSKSIDKYDPYNSTLLKVLISWDICKNKQDTLATFEDGISSTPNNINIYIEYWKFLKYLKKSDKEGSSKSYTEKMISLSERMLKAADNYNVPTDQWIEAHDIRFKSLLMKDDTKETIEEAVNTLKKVWYILPPLPVDGLWYIQDAQEEAEIQQQLKLGLNDETNQESPEKLDTNSSSNPKTLLTSQTASSGYFLSLKDGRSHLPHSKQKMLLNIR